MDIELVRTAYRKLKSHIYYDNSNLLLRMQLAEYESSGNIDQKLEELAEKIAEYGDTEQYWNDLFEKISSWSMVKQYESAKNDALLITNLTTDTEYKVDRVNHFIDAPIELHVCAAIWLCLVGHRLEPLMTVVPFGNKLELYKDRDDFKLVNGLKLYKPYFREYQTWRDQAVGAAKDLVNKNKNALILGLDIKEFYHSVRVDISSVHEQLYPNGISGNINSICNIFKKILTTYTTHINGQYEEGKTILPIGLVSSGVLANFYLEPLDKQLTSILRPEFYGRYVDDILLVVSCPDDKEYADQSEILKEYLLDTEIFKKDSGESDLYSMKTDGYEEMKIQSEKLATFYFSSKEPAALLDKFVAELKKNSSEYRLLPEDEVIEHDFDMAAYNLSYSGAGNKLRDIKEFGEDRFGVSKYLAKKIFLALQSGHESDEEAIEKIVRFFRGKRAVELYTLWEKAFTFMLLNHDYSSIFVLVKELLVSISKITKGEVGEWEHQIDNFYFRHLFASLSMALSLKPSILSDKRFICRMEAEFERNSFFETYDFNLSVKAIRTANLVRHGYIVHPLLNYVKASKKDEYYDLIDYKNYFGLAKHNLDIGRDMYRYSPRFVHFHEVTLFHIINRVAVSRSKFYASGLLFKGDSLKSDKDYLDDAAKDYFKLNYQRSAKNVGETNEDYLEIKNKLFHLERTTRDNYWTRKLQLEKTKKTDELKVAVANVMVNKNAVEHEYLRKPKIEPQRRKAFNEILNQAEDQSVDLLVMPEISVPVAWLPWVSEYARTKQRALVFGLEHWIVGKKAYNFLITLMPVIVDGFKSLVVNIRLKNHYSPAEIELLEGYGYTIPEVKNPSYDLFKWQGCHFTTFNCFELSNIEHRSRFKSKVDLLIASEFNKDISYFSNIVESSARDIHCYILQVNDSRYGDSRVTQPAKSETKDLIKVKGGKNPTILVETLNLKLLREFQLKEYSGQRAMGLFKPTPPDFDKDNVLKRIS
jgi:hypothetical protein